MGLSPGLQPQQGPSLRPPQTRSGAGSRTRPQSPVRKRRPNPGAFHPQGCPIRPLRDGSVTEKSLED